MKQFTSVIIIFTLSLWSCKNQISQTVRPINDTTQLINQALNIATSDRYMPSADALKRHYLFNDSILLTSNRISIGLLPASNNGQNFKIMAEHEILRTLKADSKNIHLPNYLNISNLEVNESGYYIEIQNLSALPFGGGGSLGMYYIKKVDSLINVNRSASSIN